jgi:hypothetical protein
MLNILVLLIVSVIVLVLLLLVIVRVGIGQEPPSEELSEQASSSIAVFVRCMLGVHVHKPNSPLNLDLGDERPCLARVTSLADPVHKPNPNAR